MKINIERILSFFIDYIIIGFAVYYSLEPFYSAQDRFLSENFLIIHLSEIIFIIYLLISFILFKKTIGMKLFKYKLYTEDCIFKVSILRIFLIILIPLNIIYYPIRKKFIQDELSNSEVKKEN